MSANLGFAPKLLPPADHEHFGPHSAPAFHELAVACAKQGYVTDAYECYLRALQSDPAYAPSRAEMKALEVSLPSADDRAHIRRTALEVRPFDGYVNPFELLNYDITSLAEYDDGELRRCKKKVLAEVQLGDGKIQWLGNAHFDESTIRRVLDDLDSPQTRSCHYIIYRHKPLLRFLTHGHLGYFAPLDEPAAVPVIPQDDPVLMTVAGKPFARQYNLALVRVLKAGDKVLVQAMASRYRPVSISMQDECFSAAYHYVRDLGEQISRACAKAKESPAHASSVFNSAASLVRVDVLNRLPDYFADTRADVARAIRAISVICHNQHDEADLAISVLQLAQSLRVDALTSSKFQEDHVYLSEKIKAQSANDVHVAISGRPLRINKTQFAFGALSVDAGVATGVRWGVFKQYTNGAQTSCSYLISVRSSTTVIDVECHETHFFRRNNEAESIERYQKAVMACMTYIAPRLVEELVGRIRQGTSISIGDCVLRKDGASFTTGVLFWRKDHLLPWHDVGWQMSKGYVHLYNAREPKVEFRADLRDVWNAVLLGFIVDIMKQKG